MLWALLDDPKFKVADSDVFRFHPMVEYVIGMALLKYHQQQRSHQWMRSQQQKKYYQKKYHLLEKKHPHQALKLSLL